MTLQPRPRPAPACRDRRGAARGRDVQALRLRQVFVSFSHTVPCTALVFTPRPMNLLLQRVRLQTPACTMLSWRPAAGRCYNIQTHGTQRYGHRAGAARSARGRAAARTATARSNDQHCRTEDTGRRRAAAAVLTHRRQAPDLANA